MLLPAQQRVTWTPDSSSRTQDTARGTGSARGLCQKVGVQREGSVDTGCARIASLAPTASQARPVSLSSADTQLFHVKKKKSAHFQPLHLPEKGGTERPGEGVNELELHTSLRELTQ